MIDRDKIWTGEVNDPYRGAGSVGLYDTTLRDGEQALEQPLVRGGQRARTDVLRVVAPVAVDADPDLEEGGLVLLHRTVAGRREGADAGTRPNEREAARELH
ncbi:MAG: hypothetical protein ACRDOP_04100, partial [Gaiellaceae bacterium]